MTTQGGSLGDFLVGLVHDEDAAQRYLLNPKATLAAAGLSGITGTDVGSAADDLGLPYKAIDAEPTEAIRNVLQRNYIDGRAYRKILACGDLGKAFDAPRGVLMEQHNESA